MKNIGSLLLALLLAACATAPAGPGLSLQDAIEQSAEKIANELPADSRVAIVAFESASPGISDYIMEELTGALVDRGIEVADRRNLPYLLQEFNFQMSGMVSDETAVSIGKFIGANMVITGQLIDLNGAYRYRTSAIRVEQATRASVTRLNVRGSAETRRIIAALAQQQTVVIATKYGVSEDKTPQTAGRFLDRGVMFAMRGDYETAIMDFTDAIRLNPNMSAAYMLRGRALAASVSSIFAVGENFSSVRVGISGEQPSPEQIQVFEKAIADYTQAIRLDPNNAIAYMERGLTNLQKGDNEKAINDCNHSLRLDPNNNRTYLIIGFAYAGNFDLAIEDLSQLIKLNPNVARAYYFRGEKYRYKDNYDKAIEDYNQTIRLDPNYIWAYYDRSDAYRAKGDNEKAIADCIQFIRLDPNYMGAYYQLALIYNNDHDRAIEDFSQLIRLNPNIAHAYYYRGNAYFNKKDYDRAILDYTEAIRLNPNDADAYNDRGNAYFNKGDYTRAIADYTEAIRLNPDDGDAYLNRGYTYYNAYLNRGYTYYNKKDYDQAILDYTQVLRPNFWSWHSDAYLMRGNAYYDKEDYDRAILDYTQVLRLNYISHYSDAYLMRGNAYYMKGDYTLAIADYEALLRIDPESNSAKENLELARQLRRTVGLDGK